MKPTKNDLIRFLAEANAVLETSQIEAMARSMDLTREQVRDFLDANEEEWERIKDKL